MQYLLHEIYRLIIDLNEIMHTHVRRVHVFFLSYACDFTRYCENLFQIFYLVFFLLLQQEIIQSLSSDVTRVYIFSLF